MQNKRYKTLISGDTPARIGTQPHPARIIG